VKATRDPTGCFRYHHLAPGWPLHCSRHGARRWTTRTRPWQRSSAGTPSQVSANGRRPDDLLRRASLLLHGNILALHSGAIGLSQVKLITLWGVLTRARRSIEVEVLIIRCSLTSARLHRATHWFPATLSSATTKRMQANRD